MNTTPTTPLQAELVELETQLFDLFESAILDSPRCDEPARDPA